MRMRSSYGIWWELDSDTGGGSGVDGGNGVKGRRSSSS